MLPPPRSVVVAVLVPRKTNLSADRELLRLTVWAVLVMELTLKLTASATPGTAAGSVIIPAPSDQEPTVAHDVPPVPSQKMECPRAAMANEKTARIP